MTYDGNMVTAQVDEEFANAPLKGKLTSNEAFVWDCEFRISLQIGLEMYLDKGSWIFKLITKYCHTK